MKLKFILAIATLSLSFFVATNTDNAQVDAATCNLTTAKSDLQDYYGNRATGANHILTGYDMNVVKMRNTSKSCTYTVGIASYKAYENYTVSVKSQEYYTHKAFNIGPGKTWEHTIAVPSCAYQVDVYYGSLLNNFKTTTYSGEKRLLDAYFYPDGIRARAYCVKPTVVPTVVKTTCPAGTKWNDKNKNGKVDNGECEATTTTIVNTTCPAGTKWNDKNNNKKVDSGECETTTTTIVVATCPSGTVWVDKNKNKKVDAAECEQPVTSTCPTGNVWIDRNNNKKVDAGECEIPSKAVCPIGTVWVDKNNNKKVDADECEQPITSTCPTGTVWVDKNNNDAVDDGECEKPIITVCPSESIWVDKNDNKIVDEGECEKPVVATCPQGTVWVDKNNNKLADEGECDLPAPSATPTPTVLSHIEELPSTGPGAAVVVSMFGLVGGLLARRHNMFDRFQNKPKRPVPPKYNHQS